MLRVRRFLLGLFALLVAISPASASTYSTLILADGAVGYWRLGEASGTTAVDAVGANNMTYKNSPVLGVTGALVGDADTAITLNGLTNFRTVNVSAVPLTATDNFTLEAWIKPGTQNDTQGCVIWTGSSTAGYGLCVDSTNHPRGYFNTGSGLTDAGTNALSTSVYSLVHLVRLSGVSSVWVNCVQVDPGTNNTSSPSTPTTRTSIGSTNDSVRFYVGSADEAAEYPAAMSQSTMCNHYNVGQAIVAARHGITTLGVGR